MPLDLDAILAIEAKCEVVEGNLVILGDDGSRTRNEVLLFLFGNCGHGRIGRVYFIVMSSKKKSIVLS